MRKTFLATVDRGRHHPVGDDIDLTIRPGIGIGSADDGIFLASYCISEWSHIGVTHEMLQILTFDIRMTTIERRLPPDE